MCPRRPVWIPEDAPPLFPDPRSFDANGLVAGGGDLSRTRLLAAYRQGLFPWFNEPPILWWSPDPRAVIDPEHLHVSRSLLRALRKTNWRIRASWDLDGVLLGCAEREEGTWLSAEMHAAYAELGRHHHALAYEVHDGDELVGGLYGVLLGGLFAAESKFHRATDASKLALMAAVTHSFAWGVRLFDVQFLTPHLESLGVYELPRELYLERLGPLTAEPAPLASEPAPSTALAAPHPSQAADGLLGLPSGPPGVGVDLVPWLRSRFDSSPSLGGGLGSSLPPRPE
ncbi:MAG TPA: leucyl/phenylalanyl-tRNA--protein transferase [Polyangiaceae bacterium]|nr:leucyl/phenylalanyl-tRNA--protein transferase [Polyangiaceae bacterium]